MKSGLDRLARRQECPWLFSNKLRQIGDYLKLYMLTIVSVHRTRQDEEHGTCDCGWYHEDRYDRSVGLQGSGSPGGQGSPRQQARLPPGGRHRSQETLLPGTPRHLRGTLTSCYFQGCPLPINTAETMYANNCKILETFGLPSPQQILQG